MLPRFAVGRRRAGEADVDLAHARALARLDAHPPDPRPGMPLRGAALARVGEVTVVAPERDRSGAANSLTLDRPLVVRRAANGYFSVNGTPTDCVHIAVTGLLDFTPDVIVSGVNLGANMGDDTIYSGTVAAAVEGYLLGIPSLAVSPASKAGGHSCAAR